MNSILKANQLTKTFDAKTIPVHAVKEVNIDIHEGEITAVSYTHLTLPTNQCV